jgi:hypothetical protein
LTDKNQLDKEIQEIVEKLITWKKEIFADNGGVMLVNIRQNNRLYAKR